MLRVGENGADSLDSQDLTAHHDRLADCLAGGLSSGSPHFFGRFFAFRPPIGTGHPV